MREGAHPNLMDAVVDFLALERAQMRASTTPGQQPTDAADSSAGAPLCTQPLSPSLGAMCGRKKSWNCRCEGPGGPPTQAAAGDECAPHGAVGGGACGGAAVSQRRGGNRDGG